MRVRWEFVLYQPELIMDAKATLGEGPSWDQEKNLLYWVDILGKKIHIFDPKSKSNNTIEVDHYVGAAVPKKSGGLMLALQNGFYSMNLDSQQLTPIVDPEEHLLNNRFNDGKCDVSGRFWAGTMALDDSFGAGSLYCLEVTNTVKTKVEKVTTSNGITWSPDNKTMYYTDTPTNQIVAFDFDIESGSINNKRVVVNIPREMGYPDGMTSDIEGMLWIAHWEGSQVSRWNPVTGNLLESIALPAPLVTSCAFGGENMEELFVTTARVGLTQETLQKYPHSGGVFSIKTGVKGLKMYPFGG